MKNSVAILLLGLAGSAMLAGIARAHESGDEFIESFDTRLHVLEDGGLEIGHTIRVHPHGDSIRRGVFFELPDGVGPLADHAVAINGEPVPPELDDGAIVAAAPEALELHETHTIEIAYRAGAPWWLADPGVARLRWEPVIEQFDLARRQASLRLSWPAAYPPPELPAVGSRAGNVWQLTIPGPASEQAATPPPGMLEVQWDAATLPPEAVRRHGTDWAWRAALGFAMLGLLLYLHLAWRAHGRDPDLGRVASRPEPPEGVSAAAARYLDRMGFDETAFVSALVAMKVKRVIDLEVDAEEQMLRLERRGEPSVLSAGERAVFETVFADSGVVELEPGDSRGTEATRALEKVLENEHRGRHFTRNQAPRLWGLALGFGVIALGLVALVVQAANVMSRDPVAIGAAIAALVVGLFAPLAYYDLFKAPTRAGVGIKRQIAGLKRYLAEERPAQGDARHFVALLPYAVALDAEEAWRSRFGESIDADVDTGIAEVVQWYRRLRQAHASAAAIVPVIAASSGASAATAGDAGGASAGGV